MNTPRAQFIVSRLLEADPDDVDFKQQVLHIPGFCKKCGSDVDQSGYCADLTCPFSDWPQQVEEEEIYHTPREELERKYGIVSKPKYRNEALDPDDINFKRFSLKHGHKPCRLVSSWDGWKCACGRWSMVTSPFDMTGVEKKRAKQEWADHRDRVQRVREAIDPDEVDPRVMLKKLPGHYWIVSFEGAKDVEGRDIEVDGPPALDYPVQAVSKEDAEALARAELTKAGYDLDQAILIYAGVAEKGDWDQLRQIWVELTQQDIERGKFGATWSHRCAHCNKRVKQEQGVLVDDTGGDVCGHAGGNEPHEPK